MTRYGYVIRQGGDPEISGALADGIQKATPAENPAKLEADRIAQVWIDQQRLRRAVGNFRTPEDYALLTVKARGDYALWRLGPIRTAMLQLAGLFALFLAWEERCWRGDA